MIHAMIVNAPFKRPEAPRPAIPLPTINIVDEVAAPQSTDPSSKTAKNVRNDH
jgi:hypothetical protein